MIINMAEVYTIHRGPVIWYDITAIFSHIQDWCWRTVIGITPKDDRESTIFHAIALACFTPYTTGIMKGERVNRDKIVIDMKLEMAQRLGYETGVGSAKQFDILNGGHPYPISYDDLYAQFIGTAKSSPYMLEHISNCIDRDIYVYDDELKDLWLLGDEEYRIKYRNSIVLYHKNGVFDLIGICKSDDVVFSQFSPDSEFIKFIIKRLENIKSKK